MLSEEHDLSDVLRVVGEGTIQRLENGMGFTANGGGAEKVFGGELLKGIEDASPAGFPDIHQFGAADGRDFEFLVAVTVRFLPIAGEEVSEARAHVAGKMFDQDCNRVGFGIEGEKELIVGELCDGTLCHTFVASHLAADFVEVVRCEFGHTADYTVEDTAEKRVTVPRPR